MFEGHWSLLSETKPSNAKRVLLTNGDSIVIGSVNIQDNIINWMFDRTDMDGYDPIAWMELPQTFVVQKHEKITDEKTI